MRYAPVASRRRNKPAVDLKYKQWPTGYMSYTDAIRANPKALLDMTNCDLYQDGIPGTRPGTVKYGTQPIGKVIGVGKFVKATVVAKPEIFLITVQVIDGVGKVLISKDGGPWNEVGGSYNTSAWHTFTQSNNRVYISNGKNKMSYYDIKLNKIVEYLSIAPPATPTAVATGLPNSVVTYRYRISANNKVGETQASAAALVTVGEYRDSWDPTTQYVTLTWQQVAGAASYNVYIGTTAGDEKYLGNINQPTSGEVKFIDNNRAAINPFKKVPEGNSTEGPMLTNLEQSNGQLFGTGDVNNPYRFWYSGAGDKAGDFSPFNGGGWVDINLGGDSVPVCCRGFRDGQGKSAVTILTRGAAGKGELYHQTFAQQTVGDFTITYPDIQKANGQAGTYSAMAVVEADNSLYYPSGTAFKTTGTKAQMVNILVTHNITDTIGPDVKSLNLAALDKSVGLEYGNRIYWALPVGSTKNNEIWIHSLRDRGAWILRWTIPCDYMWLYEDSLGNTHHCILSNNKILEFSESALDDDGTPFRTRLELPTITFDDSALQMASIDTIRWLFLRPQGRIVTNTYGLLEGNESEGMISSEEIYPASEPTGWDIAEFNELEFDYVLPASSQQSLGQLPVVMEVDETLSQMSVDITTTGRSRYLLNSMLVKGKLIPGLYQGDE